MALIFPLYRVKGRMSGQQNHLNNRECSDKHSATFTKSRSLCKLKRDNTENREASIGAAIYLSAVMTSLVARIFERCLSEKQTDISDNSGVHLTRSNRITISKTDLFNCIRSNEDLIELIHRMQGPRSEFAANSRKTKHKVNRCKAIFRPLTQIRNLSSMKEEQYVLLFKVLIVMLYLIFII